MPISILVIQLHNTWQYTAFCSRVYGPINLWRVSVLALALYKLCLILRVIGIYAHRQCKCAPEMHHRLDQIRTASGPAQTRV